MKIDAIIEISIFGFFLLQRTLPTFCTISDGLDIVDISYSLRCRYPMKINAMIEISYISLLKHCLLSIQHQIILNMVMC
jgi:hypothetical protein